MYAIKFQDRYFCGHGAWTTDFKRAHFYKTMKPVKGLISVWKDDVEKSGVVGYMHKKEYTSFTDFFFLVEPSKIEIIEVEIKIKGEGQDFSL